MTVLERVKAEYVDQVDDETLIRGAIDGMLASLDPHSSYLDERGFRSADDHHRRQLWRPRPHRHHGGRRGEGDRGDPRTRPADRAGIKSGDFITHIDGRLFYGGTLDEAVDRMRGAPGHQRARSPSSARAATGRSTSASPARSSTFRRSARRCATASASSPSPPSAATPPRRRSARWPTSSASSAARRSATSSTCAPIRAGCSTRRSASPTCSSSAARSSRSAAAAAPTSSVIMPGPATPPSGVPIIVLVDAGTASAAEIVAAALQDHRRAIVMGERTFGKGSVQTLIPLGRGSTALRLTTARYYTPSGPLGAGGRHHARHRGAAAVRSRLPARAPGSANPTCGATWSTRSASART